MATGEEASVHFSYVDIDGAAHNVVATVGETLMAVAKNHLIRGIDGDCGGNCACGTCHIVIGKALADKLPPHDSSEADLLAFVGFSPSDGHRLGCQIPVTRELEDAVITVGKSA